MIPASPQSTAKRRGGRKRRAGGFTVITTTSAKDRKRGREIGRNLSYHSTAKAKNETTHARSLGQKSLAQLQPREFFHSKSRQFAKNRETENRNDSPGGGVRVRTKERKKSEKPRDERTHVTTRRCGV